jgi:hypothetical protein
MALHRVLKTLSTGHVPGDLVDGDQFKYLDVLVEKKALSKVASPPLSELPGWTTRAKTLEPLDIVTIADFLDADDEVLKGVFNYKTTRSIKRWRDELRKWLVVDGPQKRS